VVQLSIFVRFAPGPELQNPEIKDNCLKIGLKKSFFVSPLEL